MLDTKNFTKYLNRHEIEAAVQSIANRLDADYAEKDVVFVGVLKGCIVFMADLARAVRKFDPEIEFVRMATFGKTANSPGTISFQKDIQLDLKDRHVLIIEEIIDSGRKLKYLHDRILQADPASVEVVTLLDKSEKRMVDTPVKYIGKKTNDQFLVGYGLDLEEKCRNLGDIFYLKYPN